MSKRAPWVPNRISDAEVAANVAMIKTLAADLDPVKANYCATLESIAARATCLFADEARFVGRRKTV